MSIFSKKRDQQTSSSSDVTRATSLEQFAGMALNHEPVDLFTEVAQLPTLHANLMARLLGGASPESLPAYEAGQHVLVACLSATCASCEQSFDGASIDQMVVFARLGADHIGGTFRSRLSAARFKKGFCALGYPKPCSSREWLLSWRPADIFIESAHHGESATCAIKVIQASSLFTHLALHLEEQANTSVESRRTVISALRGQCPACRRSFPRIGDVLDAKMRGGQSPDTDRLEKGLCLNKQCASRDIVLSWTPAAAH